MPCRLLRIKLYSALHALSSFCHALSSAKTLLVSFSSCFVIILSCSHLLTWYCLSSTLHAQLFVLHSNGWHYYFQIMQQLSVTPFCYMVFLFSLMQVIQDSQHAKLLLRLVSNGLLILFYLLICNANCSLHFGTCKLSTSKTIHALIVIYFMLHWIRGIYIHASCFCCCIKPKYWEYP